MLDFSWYIFFVLHRAYLTPAKIKKYFNINTAQCPRCTLEGAEFEHMMWSFPQLGTYWEEVGNLLRKITDRQIDADIGTFTTLVSPHLKNKGNVQVYRPGVALGETGNNS